VHITILSAPVKHASLTEAVPSLSVARPLQGAPEDIENPPSGPHEFIVVGGAGGCGATCKHPLAINPAIANPAIVNLKSATIGTIPRIRPPPSACIMMKDFDPAPNASIVSARDNRVAPVGSALCIRKRALEALERPHLGTGG
jgi:hypothetical protein